MYKLIIAGSRHFNDYELLRKIVLPYVNNIDCIISGTASGADTLGERFAQEYNIPIKKFPADWSKYGKSAGPRRNKQMAEYANACIVFWDGQSRGTLSMINYARQYNLSLKIINYSKT